MTENRTVDEIAEVLGEDLRTVYARAAKTVFIPKCFDFPRTECDECKRRVFCYAAVPRDARGGRFTCWDCVEKVRNASNEAELPPRGATGPDEVVFCKRPFSGNADVSDDEEASEEEEDEDNEGSGKGSDKDEDEDESEDEEEEGNDNDDGSGSKRGTSVHEQPPGASKRARLDDGDDVPSIGCDVRATQTEARDPE